jgi:hypothetical protein
LGAVLLCGEWWAAQIHFPGKKISGCRILPKMCG